MSMVINTNVASINSQRQLNATNNVLKTSMERLSSGLRVNSAKDDAAGLAIGNAMNSQIRGMTVAVRNANDGISMAQTAEAGMGVITDTLQRMRDLAVQAANDGAVTGNDREKLNAEYQQLSAELVRIVENTEFNGKKILDGDLSGGVNFQVGANTAANNQISVTVAGLKGAALASVTGTGGGAAITGTTASNALAAITAIDNAIKTIDTSRAELGAIQNRFTTTIANLQSSIENQSAARSRIMDADFAAETAALSRNQILQQAGVAMLAQANQAPQTVLSLLR
ncbi:flagellin N-terminal helical domain-containing protein [Methylotuvimicrobium alcaliphilum]|uniref:Flagellin n=1 Tax=Methylotuvimicrobium alcaliphilum (strain DSM 19304 / NCIMB 14124 / VKM B-2133 / 20Z) TaxID=1091494 RepID=G4T1L9_META2|nr:flagellin [Methylotuvimicrobium alcaliphilum]CCE22441.1 Lateral flagellin [Methylotuvimicrobium alcaliphilum 20Z]